MRRIPAPSGIINDEILERFRERYEARRPKVLYAYSTVLAAFAAYMQKHGMKHRPTTIIATAEVMNDENRQPRSSPSLACPSPCTMAAAKSA